MIRITLIALAILGLSCLSVAQKDITLEAIWKDYEYMTKSVPGFNFLKDGKHYTRLEGNKIQQYDLAEGKLVSTILDPATLSGFNGRINGYSFSEDEGKILIETESEPIYRRSSRANYFVYDRKSASIEALYPVGKQQYASFNPQADKVAFVHDNNLYYKDLANGKVAPITQDGEYNKIIYGAADWVYEEEFSFAKAFEWSPDGMRIGYYRFDESQVKEFTMTNYRDEMYPEYVTFKYPKVGEQNSVVDIYIYDLRMGKSLPAYLGPEKDIYIPRIKWTANSDKLCIMRMNRHQNHLEMLLADSRSGETELLLEEKNKYYIGEELLDDLIFLENGKQFLWSSEMDGWRHIYLYDMKGRKVQQITKGDWEVTALYGVDEKNGRVYYQAAENSPLERQVYSIGLDGKGKQVLAGESGWNDAQFSSTYDYYVVTHSTANKPAVYSVFDLKGRLLRVIEENLPIKQKMQDYAVQPVEFFEFKTAEGLELDGWMIKPRDFKENRQYPVFMFTYGGPGSQQVTDSWKGLNFWWFQMLAQQGYLVACVDNRGTGGRGEEFKKMTYLQLGHYETIDQIEAARYLGSLKYTDPNRIGIFGWSYGGYLSSLCLLKGNDVFKAAIAVAPVTNWKWYDTIYTERYMRTYKENEKGYRENSPVYFADRLKGAYLLIHGMGDDNVHFQNTAEMANALVAANKQFDTYFYPNRNHGIFGGNTRLHLYTKMTNFLEQHLKPVGKTLASPSQPVPAQKQTPENSRLRRALPAEKMVPSQAPIRAPLEKE